MYDPRIGKFLSEDPLSFSGGDENLYRYVRNSPTIFVDPTGQEAEVPGFFGKDYEPQLTEDPNFVEGGPGMEAKGGDDEIQRAPVGPIHDPPPRPRLEPWMYEPLPPAPGSADFDRLKDLFPKQKTRELLYDLRRDRQRREYMTDEEIRIEDHCREYPDPIPIGGPSSGSLGLGFLGAIGGIKYLPSIARAIHNWWTGGKKKEESDQPAPAETTPADPATPAAPVAPWNGGAQGTWLPGRYTHSASQPNAYWASGQRVFPTQRNSGLKSDALRAEQRQFFERGLRDGKSPGELRGQAMEAGYDRRGKLGHDDHLADRGAESALQDAIKAVPGM